MPPLEGQDEYDDLTSSYSTLVVYARHSLCILTSSYLALAAYARHDLCVLTPSYLALAAYARHDLHRAAVDYPRREGPAHTHVVLPSVSSHRETRNSGLTSTVKLLITWTIDLIDNFACSRILSQGRRLE